MTVNRVPSEIRGFDSLIEGGFPDGHVILVAGAAGTGKTILSTQFIFEGASTFNQNGVYAMSGESIDDWKQRMLQFSFRLEKLEEEGKIKVLEFEPLREDGFLSNLEKITNAVKEIGAKRLVIDPLQLFVPASEDVFENQIALYNLIKALKRTGCTTILTFTVPYGATSIGTGIEEHLADSIIFLEKLDEEGEPKRRITIRKVRGIRRSLKSREFEITQEGMEIKSSPLAREANDFSKLLGLRAGEMQGRRILFEFDPQSSYQNYVRNFIHEGISSGEKVLIFTRLNSPIFSVSHRLSEVQRFIWVTCPEAWRAMPQDATGLQVTDFKAVKDQIDRIVADTSQKVRIIFDSLTDPLLLLGLSKTYSFLRDIVDVLNPQVTALFLMNTQTHSLEQVSAIRELFQDRVIISSDNRFTTDLKSHSTLT